MPGFTGIIRGNSANGWELQGQPNTRTICTCQLSNHDALLTELGLGADQDYDALLVSAWSRWGESMVEHLHGRFAFVVLDNEKGMIFAAVDRMAAIPIHYHFHEGVLCVSTVLKNLLALPEISVGVNHMMVADYLLSIGDGPALGNQTFFDGLKRLPAGHSMSIVGDDERLRRYHRPEAQEVDRNPADAVTTFRQLLTGAIAGLGGESGVGVSLSGGLDSSAIAALARKDDCSLPVFHFHSAIDDETTWVDAVIAEGGMDVTTIDCDGFMETVETMLNAVAEPWAYDNFHHDYLLLKQAAAAGCTTLLGGYYGDVTVCETLDYLKPLADAGKWKELRDECARAATIQHGVPEQYLAYVAGDRLDTLAQSKQWGALWADLRTLSELFDLSFGRLCWHYLVRPITPIPLRRAYRIMCGSDRPVWWEMNRQINPAFARGLELNQRAKRMKVAWTTPLKDAHHTHQNVIYHDSTALTLAHVYALGETVGVTAAFPFMDDALIDFCLTLPRSLHGRDGWDRWITREAMTGLLPNIVRQRTERTHYAATALAEIKHDAPAIDAFIDEWPEALDAFVDKNAFLEDWKRLTSGEPLSPPLAAANRRVRRTIILGKWLQAYG